MQDKELYAKIKEGDETAFNKSFDSYYNQLCYFADKLLADFDLSKSIVQQVFVDLWLKREKLNVHYSLKSYLYNSVRNAAINSLRHKKVESKYLSNHEQNDYPVFRDLMEEAELNDRINQAINELPERCRQVFTLCRFEGMKYAEIADELNISIKTVEMQMGIALKKLRHKLSDYQMVNLMVFLLSQKK